MDHTIMLQVVNEFLDLTSQIEKDTDRRSELADMILGHLTPGQRFEVVPGVGVKVIAAPRRFSSQLAAKVLTAEQLALISVTAPSAAGLKYIPPVLADMCKMATGAPSIRQL